MQFETKADVERALQKSGGKIGDTVVAVERPFGLLTCNLILT